MIVRQKRDRAGPAIAANVTQLPGSLRRCFSQDRADGALHPKRLSGACFAAVERREHSLHHVRAYDRQLHMSVQRRIRGAKVGEWRSAAKSFMEVIHQLGRVRAAPPPLEELGAGSP